MRLTRIRFLPVLLTLAVAFTALAVDDETGPDDPIRIRFNFKGATFDEVLDFFSRVTELPVVKEADVPEGTLDYLSPEAYELPEAMHVLNIILQARGVMLRLDDDMLYLQKLDQMQRENLPLFVGAIPETVTSDQIVTVVAPLSIAQAAPLAEHLGAMIAAYGSVAAMEQQNSLIITETAGQIRRLLRIIDELDQEDPEGAIEIFHIKNTRAAKIMEPLKALLSVKVQKIVVDQKGKRTTIEENSMPGISSMTADERTNAIIAKGVQSRLDKLAETIDILDVPATAGARAMRTVALAMISAAQAETQLNKLYLKIPEAARPTVIGHAEQASVTIVGDDQDIVEGVQLLAEIDGGTGDLSGDRTMSVFVLEHVEPAGIITALQSLLNDRQRLSTRLVAGPDGNSIIASGPSEDVYTVRSVLDVLDRPGDVERRVRLMRLTSSDPAAAVARAESLYSQEIDGEDPDAAISIELDAESRTLTLIGTDAALDRFTGVLRLVESNTVVSRETRQFEVTNTTPSAIVAPLRTLARQLLAGDGTDPYNEPVIEAIDALGVLLVSAEPGQFAILDSGIATLDRPGPGDALFRVLPLTGVSDPQAVIARADQIFQMLRIGARPEPERPDVEFDELTGNLVVRGPSAGVRIYEQAISESRRLMPPARTARLLAVNQARVEDVVEPLSELLARTAPVDPARTVPPPTIEAVGATNSLYVVAEPTQHEVIARYLLQLDHFELTTLPPLRLIQVRAADAMALSTLLRQRYDGRPSEQRRDAPVDVSADAATNTLIVVAHESVFEEIKSFVDEVNRSGESTAERETMLFPLKRARAMDVASALEKLYPEPPMPLDRRGRPMPHLREPRDVHVSADAATNTLIVEAPIERRSSFEALVEQLDRVELPPSAELRTYHIERGDPTSIARTLSELARQGIMSETPPDGSKPVEVTIQAEPQSRTLIVAGDEVTFAKTEAVLRDLQAVPVPRALRIFDVTGADPAELSETAQRLYAEQTAEIPDAGPVAVEVDPENATILVVADDEAMMRFSAILTELRDAIGPPASVRLLPLQYADAGEIVRFVEDLIQSDVAMLAGGFGPPPAFEAIPRTNSVLVAAQDEQHAVIAALVNSLDNVDREMPPLRILQLRTADAQNLARALMDQYSRRPIDERNTRPVSISADEQTNALMIAAHPDVMPEIEAIITELNSTTRLDTEGREIRIFPLKVARAEELARVIDEMYPEPPAPVDRRGRPMTHLKPPREVVVRADPQTNSLIVDAPIQRLAGFEQLVEQLDRQKIAEATEVRTYRVVHADLAAIAGTLQQLASDGALNPEGHDRRVPVSVTTEPVSRTLIVAGPMDVFARVEQVVNDLDAPRTGPATSLRFFKLEFARADTIADMLRDVLSSRIAEELPEAVARLDTLLQVTADRKTNTLIVSAPTTMMPVAEMLVEQLDGGSASIGDPVVRVRPLTFADAADVSNALSNAIREMISPATGEKMQVELIASGGSNALILVGLTQDLDEVETLIEPLDARPATDAIDAKTFALEHAEAGVIAPVVERLLTDQQETDPRIIMERIRRSRGEVTLTPNIRVEADERTNALIVSGPQQTVALAQTLIDQLDRPDDTAGVAFDMFTPRNAEPAALASTVQTVIESSRPTGRRSTLMLIAEPNSTAIVVVGGDEERANAVALLARWDAQAVTPPQIDFTILPLEHSDANVVAAALRPMLADQTRWPAELRTAARAGVQIGQPTVTADVAANRLLLSMPAALGELALSIVGQLDRPRDGSGTLDVRIFNLDRAKAAQVAQAIGEAVRARQSRMPGSPPATVTAEESSNSLVVTADPAQLDFVADMVTQLDEGVAVDQSQVRTIFLRHARAENVAPVVEQLLGVEKQDLTDVPRWMRWEFQMQDEPSDIKVAADTRLNAVVIAAPVTVLNVAEQMVAQLDVESGAVADESRRSVRVLAIQNADAAELADSLEAIFSATDLNEAPPTIRVDRASNALIARASPDQFRTIEEVVTKIDRASVVTSRQMKLIPIDPSRGAAEDIARTLERLLDRSGSGRVEVIQLEDLIRKRSSDQSSLDDASSSAGFFVGGSRWAVLSAMVLGALPATPNDDEQDESADADIPPVSDALARLAEDADVTIAVDPKTNSLVVVGSPRAIERVTALTDQILDQIPAQPGTVRYIGLPEAVDSQRLAKLVNDTLARLVPIGSRGDGYRNRVTVLADATTNALIVVANETDFEIVGDLVAALSQPAATESVVVKIYPLTTITVDRAEDSMNALLGVENRGRRGRDRQAERMRNVAVTLLAEGTSIEAVFDPQRIRLASDQQSNTLIVTAPPEAIQFIDQYIELLDQTPVNTQATLKIYKLDHANASDLVDTLRRLVRVRFRSMERGGAIEPEVTADERTNTLLVTASPELLGEIDRLLVDLDSDTGEDVHPLTTIELASALPSTAAEIIDRIVIGNDQRRRAATLIVPDDNSGVLLVRADPGVLTEVKLVIEEIDRDSTTEFAVRTITLERADAVGVAQALQTFFDDRARIASSGRGRRERGRRVSIIGDSNTHTLLVAASDEDYGEIEKLVAQFDSPESAGTLSFRVFPLEHAEAQQMQRVVQELVNDLTFGQQMFFFWPPQRNQGGGRESKVAVRADERLNALIVTGDGNKFELVESLIEVLDQPTGTDAERVVRLYTVNHADIGMVARLLEDVFTNQSRTRRWWEESATDIEVHTDARSNTLIVSAIAKQHDEIGDLIAEVDTRLDVATQQIDVLPLEYAEADELAETLSTFLSERASATNAPDPSATILASASANSLIVSASVADLATIRDLLTRIDQPDVSGDRVVEIIAIRDGDAEEIARIIDDQFGRRGSKRVVVTPDLRTSSIIINAPREEYAQAKALIDQLDAPAATDETIIRTYTLDSARAEEVENILAQTLHLDARGETTGVTVRLDEDSPAVEVIARVVADSRSNSLIVTATEESFPVIEQLIRQVDEVPAAAPREWRIIPLEHARAYDVFITLDKFLRTQETVGPEAQIDYHPSENQLVVAATADQFEQIDKVITQIDVPDARRQVTEFVALEFVEAEKVREALAFFYGKYAPGAETIAAENVRIVADPASNSLVISADEAEWEAIRALLTKLDSEEHDASLQLQVVSLQYADATSVARAINEAFQVSSQRDQRGGQSRDDRRANRGDGGDDERRPDEVPTVLVESEEWVRAAAEPLTNSIVVSASRKNLRKIESIIEQLDVSDFARLPAPRIIPVSHGDPQQLAQSVERLYATSGAEQSRRTVRIVADPASSALIVRADAEEFEQIRALAGALQQEATSRGLAVRVVRLTSTPAVRVAEAVRAAYQTRAEEAGLALSIEVDSGTNSLVVAATPELFQEIEATARQLDGLVPAAGQGIFIIELEHVAPEAAKRVIETIGLHERQPEDSVSRLVSEPITVSVLEGRSALVVVANPIDRDTVVGLLKSIDQEPALAESRVRVVRLRTAEAGAVASILEQVLSPGEQQAQTPMATALREQVRRLAVRRDGLEEPDIALDLTNPIRLIPDERLNAIVIASTPANVEALEALVMMFDTLPITESVTVQLFPLENIAADQFARIVRELFDQGAELGNVPGSDVSGVPAGTVGRALLEEVAMSVDERTNTVIVAGKEDGVALVEVLSRRLDSDVATGWVEPRIVQLQYADAENLADLLTAIVVEGNDDLPQSSPLERQVARLRMARRTENGGAVLESDVFQPMTRLLIRAEAQLNAIVLVGTPANLEVVTELIGMLDVEAASPSAVVRIYPIEHASASRLGTTLTNLFQQQVDSKAIRPEDRVIVQPDERTNALVVTTSTRSFAVLERLIEMLDSEVAPDLREIRMIKLENASATRIADLVQDLMDARLERLREVQPETADFEKATVMADPRTNNLVIAAGNESYDVVARLAADLDASTLADASLVEVISVDHANVDRLAETLNQVMERRYADVPENVRRSQRPLVLTDPRSRSLLVAANPEDLAAIRDLTAKLELAPVNPAVDIHVLALETGRAEDLAPMIEQLMREREETLGDAATPVDKIAIEADTASNSLIVAASDENLLVIERLIAAIGEAGPGAGAAGTFEVIPVTNGRASDVLTMLQDLYVEDENRRRGEDTVRVSADERINGLIVNAPPGDIAAIRRLVAQLDGARPSSVVEIKYIPLKSANALETVSLINNVLAGRGIGVRGRSTQRSTVIKYLRQMSGDLVDEVVGDADDIEVEVSAAIRESIVLTPDVRTNTIIVSAPRESMAMIERMIEDLDSSSTGAQSIRIFKLVNADALDMRDILTELFNLERQGNLYVLKPRESGGGIDPNALGPPGGPPAIQSGPLDLGPELTAVPDERQQLSITVDQRTNSLLVSGTPTYLDLVEDVVMELDAQDANERSVFVYPLRNADATEVATAIRTFVDAEQDTLIRTLGDDQLGSAARLLEREVTIVDDSKTNSVLVSVSPRYEERIRQIIEELDVDPPQVLIQVLLAEVTLDTSFDWGVDMMFTAGNVTGGYELASTPGLGNLPVFAGGIASAAVAGQGVPSISVSAGDFQLLIKALSVQGRLQVLSNPSVMAANNEPARIQVGETIRVPESTSFDIGSQQTSVIAEDVGIILSVTPFINPDGFVRMSVQPEISELSKQTTQISEDFQAPIIRRRTADTTVTVRDGQTIVIGGLISDRYERRDTKVPLFGDLPIIGPLFRNESVSTVKTELLIVLTPHVIESPGQIDLLTTEEIDRLSLPTELKDQIRKSMLEGRLFDAKGNRVGGNELEGIR